MGNPIVESRIREIQAGKLERDAKRAAYAARLAERQAADRAEHQESISPRDVERAAARQAVWDFWNNIYEREQQREHHKLRKEAIAEMAKLKAEWEKPETTPTRRGQILRQYGELYRLWEPKPNTTSDETILNYWLGEKRKAALARIYGAAT